MNVLVGVVKRRGSASKKTRDGEQYESQYAYVKGGDDELYPTKITFARDFGRLPEVGDALCVEVWLKPWQMDDGRRGVAMTAVRPLALADLTEASGVGAGRLAAAS
ncbi:MAG: hypothetical protein QM779_04880 [Propionicimonas sp.]|uniref:hypothetical protein n=1 Tax=Propionicimonas sp. TaxID=1955623 RepID=UPI003D0FD363